MAANVNSKTHRKSSLFGQFIGLYAAGEDSRLCAQTAREAAEDGAAFSLWQTDETTIPHTEPAVCGLRVGDAQTTLNGRATLSGLLPGDDWLVKEDAPDGYFLPTRAFKFQLTGAGKISVDLSDGLLEGPEDENEIRLIDKNKPFFELPATGGRDGRVIPAPGRLAMLASITAVLLMRRRQERRVIN